MAKEISGKDIWDRFYAVCPKSQAEVSRILGYNPQRINAWVNDPDARPKYEDLLRLASIADCTVDYLLTGKKEAPAFPQGLKGLLSDMPVTLIDPPATCPNRGICLRLSKLAQLLAASLTVAAEHPDAESRMDDALGSLKELRQPAAKRNESA